MSKVIATEQRTEEWYQARLGKFTCSEVYNLLTEPKLKADKEAGNLSKSALSYIYTKIAEQLTGKRQEVSSKAMEWGTEYEPYARSMYEQVFEPVTEVGFIYDGRLGGSPDGLVGEKGGIEIKCPYTYDVHLENLLLTKDTFKQARKEYYWQIMGCMFLTEREWWDFVSFHPDFPEEHCMQVIRIERNEDDILLMMDKVEKACQLRDAILKSL